MKRPMNRLPIFAALPIGLLTLCNTASAYDYTWDKTLGSRDGGVLFRATLTGKYEKPPGGSDKELMGKADGSIKALVLGFERSLANANVGVNYSVKNKNFSSTLSGSLFGGLVSVSKSSSSGTRDQTLAKVAYPLVPLITLDLSVKATLSYGFDVQSPAKPSGAVACLRPRLYAGVGIVGDISAKIWGVVRGGLTASANGSGDVGARFVVHTNRILMSADAVLALTFKLDAYADYADWGWTGYDWESLFRKTLVNTTLASSTSTIISEFRLADI